MEITKDQKQRKFAFSKTNYVLLIIGLVMIALGFFLMLGPGTTETHFEEDIFSVRRISVAPVTSFLGYVFLIFSILYKKRDKQ